MKKSQLLRSGRWLPVVALPLLCLTACQDKLVDDPHYKAPDFLVGNAIKVLENDGQYATFLRAIELIGYTDVVNTQLLTVLAPTDEAFAQFLQEKGYSSIDDLYAARPDYLKELVSYHLIYFAMDWEKMTNFRPEEGDGATEADKARSAGLYNRFRTRSQHEMETRWNSDPSVRDSVKVVHFDRYLTVFSERMFKTLGIDAARNYNYFFPGTKWNPTGNANGFNVMNAAVLDNEAVVTDNGYLYHIDHVLEPCGTIYEELSERQDYQMFCKLFDQYKYYVQDVTESEKRGYPVYKLSFEGLPDIAQEWMSSQYQNYLVNSFASFNIFAPTDQAMQRMFSEYWEKGCGYSSVETLNPLIQRILMLECLALADVKGDGKDYTSYTCYPDFLDNGRAVSNFETQLTTPSSAYDQRIVCNNGVIFGATQMEVPGVFASAAGPAFKDARYLPYLYVLDGSGMLTNFASNATKHVTLIPDTAQFTAERMRLFKETTDGVSTYTLQQWNDEAGDYSNMGNSLKKQIVNMNTADEVSEIPMKGTAVIETNMSFNYWFVRDGKMTTNALFNEQLNPTFSEEIWYPFHEIERGGGKQWSNGRSYAYSNPGIYQPVADTKLEKELSQNNDRDYPYYCFSQLLRLAGLAAGEAFTTTGAYTVRTEQDKIEENRFIVFIPTNDAIKAALQTLPGCKNLTINEQYVISGKATQADLASYLLSYFLVHDRQAISTYPYPGSSCKGDFETGGKYGLRINDDGSQLSVSAINAGTVGNPVPVVSEYYYLPFAYGDGAFHLIEGVF